jgi:glycosyltransferase involved in cell wall biosynthesis
VSDTNLQLALVLATYNRARPLARLLNELRAQTLDRSRWELIVCVDGSTDDTMQVLEAEAARNELPLRFFRQENAGQSVARHRAIVEARAERVVVTDDDMGLCPEFFEEHLRAAAFSPTYAVVLGKSEPPKTWKSGPLFEAVRDHQMLLQLKEMERGWVPSAFAFTTANVSFSRELYLRIGGFDFGLRLHEDCELGMRLERAGAKFVFHAAAYAIHYSDVGSYEKWERRQFEYGRVAVQVWDKLGKDPMLHPLRNLVNGNPANRAAVYLLSRNAMTTRAGTELLRAIGGVLKKAGVFWPALATHKAIYAIQYHAGVREALGSWSALRESEKAFMRDPRRPLEPTRRGKTHSRDSSSSDHT